MESVGLKEEDVLDRIKWKNAGVAVFVADTTSMCGFVSDGADI